MRLTVISHFYNEEFLLPYWLRHHTQIFDHGVLIDYQSTDRSVEIIKELAPNWEIRPSHYTVFDPFTLDMEVSEIEQELKGWKTALNTTEFLVHHNIRGVIQEVEDKLPSCLGILPAGVALWDSEKEYDQPLTHAPLFMQRFTGWVESPPPYGHRHRLIHRANHGHYHVGRHDTALTQVVYRPDVFCVWCGWSPYPQVKQRKLQIQDRMPPQDHRNLGWQHRVTSEVMDDIFWRRHHSWRFFAPKDAGPPYSLLTCPEYSAELSHYMGKTML